MRDEKYYKSKKEKRERKNTTNSKGFNPLNILFFLVGLLIVGIIVSFFKK